MAWWKTAKPGDKVVCVDDRLFWFNKPRWWQIWKRYKGSSPAYPVKGQVYTVNCIRADHVSPYGFWVVLKELPNEEIVPSAFRPVQENKKSTEAGMQALRKHLTGKTVEVV